MAHISNKLDPRADRRAVLAAKGKRVTHRLTFNPSSANPKETLYVDVPRLPEDTVLVPGSLALVADFEFGGTRHANNRVVANLGRCLVRRRVVRIGTTTLQDLERADLVGIYTDNWLPDTERSELVEQGIQTTAVNKIRSDAGDKGSDAGDIATAAAFPKYRIPLDIEPLRTHGALHTASLPLIRLELTLAAPEDVIVSPDSTKVGTYTLKNIELVYQVIESMEFARLMPRSFLYNHICHHKVITYAKATDTKIADTIPVQLRSFVGLLFLFVDPHTAGARASEAFPNPTVTKVEFDVNGVPNTLYPAGMLPSDLWETIRGGAAWLLQPGSLGVKRPEHFWKDKFAIFVDLRSARDHSAHGDGRASLGAGKNIAFRVHRTAGGSGNGNCHVFILGDGAFDLETGAALY